MFLGVYPDGKDITTGKRSGVASQMKELVPHCMSTHYFLHCSYLDMKSSWLNQMLNIVIYVIVLN